MIVRMHKGQLLVGEYVAGHLIHRIRAGIHGSKEHNIFGHSRHNMCTRLLGFVTSIPTGLSSTYEHALKERKKRRRFS